MDITFEDFARDADTEGFDEVLVRTWKPGEVLPEHSHPFEAKALVIEGEMWLTEGGVTRHFTAGEGYRLQPGVPHAERYGDKGTSLWVARRTP